MSERKKNFYGSYLVLSLFIISLSAYGDTSECNDCQNRKSQTCNQLHPIDDNIDIDASMNRLEIIQNCIVNSCQSVCGTNTPPNNQQNQPDLNQHSGFSDFNDQTGQRIQDAENLQTSSQMGQLSAGATAKKNSKLQQFGGMVANAGGTVATGKSVACFASQNYPCGALWAGVAISLFKTASNLNDVSNKNNYIAGQWGTQDDDGDFTPGFDGGYRDLDNTDFPCQGEECPDGTTTPGTTTPGTTTPGGTTSTDTPGGTTTPGTTTPGTTTPGTTTPGTTTPGTTTPGTTTPGTTTPGTTTPGTTTPGTTTPGTTTPGTTTPGTTTPGTTTPGTTTPGTTTPGTTTPGTTTPGGPTTGGPTTGGPTTGGPTTTGATDSGDPIPSPNPTLNNKDASPQELAFNQELQQWKGAGGGGNAQELNKLLNKHNIKIDPNGNITLPGGKQMNISKLQAQLSPAQQKAFQAFQNKLKGFGDKVANMNFDDSKASKAKDSKSGFKGYGGGGSRDPAFSGTDSSDMLAGDIGFGGDSKSSENNIGSTIAGMAVQKGGSLIGVRQDNIFDMIHRRYQKKRKKTHFVELK